MGCGDCLDGVVVNEFVAIIPDVLHGPILTRYLLAYAALLEHLSS